VNVLPEFNSEGDLPSGVNVVAWQDFHSRFGLATPRRVWLLGRLRRVFVWGGFVTTKPAPRDLDALPIMDEDFEVERIAPPASEVFDSTRAKLRFESDVFSRPRFHWPGSPTDVARYIPDVQGVSEQRPRKTNSELGISAALRCLYLRVALARRGRSRSFRIYFF
jgi:hypothetical protein